MNYQVSFYLLLKHGSLITSIPVILDVLYSLFIEYSGFNFFKKETQGHHYENSSQAILLYGYFLGQLECPLGNRWFQTYDASSSSHSPHIPIQFSVGFLLLSVGLPSIQQPPPLPYVYIYFFGGLERRFERINRHMISDMWLQPVQKLVLPLYLPPANMQTNLFKSMPPSGGFSYWWT